jgi:DNA-binding NarL/FixJ family response regulator
LGPELEVVCVLDMDGRVLQRTDDAPAHFWSELVAGRLRLVEQASSSDRRFLLVTDTSRLHGGALSAAEAEVVLLAARGDATKLIAHALEISPSAASARLARAAAKLGAGSRTNLLRLASAILGGGPRPEIATGNLTNAERAVLDLVQQGLSNAQIATLRHRSVRTIANQVAAILRKTKTCSRRALLARPRTAARALALPHGAGAGGPRGSLEADAL